MLGGEASFPVSAMSSSLKRTKPNHLETSKEYTKEYRETPTTTTRGVGFKIFSLSLKPLLSDSDPSSDA